MRSNLEGETCLQAMSECSRKDIGLQSVCSPDSPMVSPQDGDMIIENYNKAAKVYNSCLFMFVFEIGMMCVSHRSVIASITFPSTL